MGNSGWQGSLFLGILLLCGGSYTAFGNKPTLTIYNNFSTPIGRWFGWVIIIYGLGFIITALCDRSTTHKKRLADLARCKARREQEAEAAKAEDNQHP